MTIEVGSAEVHALGVVVMVIVSCHRPKGKDTEIFNSTTQNASIFRYGQDFFPITIPILHFLVILRREKLAKQPITNASNTKYRKRNPFTAYRFNKQSYKKDWLLLWKRYDNELTLLLLDTGTHSDLL